MTVLAGATGRLPCETMAMGQDRLKLVLWFRNMSDTPFYTWVYIYTYTWVSVLIMIINIISNSGLVTFLRLLFLADTFLQNFLRFFHRFFYSIFCGGIFITNFYWQWQFFLFIRSKVMQTGKKIWKGSGTLCSGVDFSSRGEFILKGNKRKMNQWNIGSYFYSEF